ncbi:MAG: hypothetical protein HPY53_11395 [Brevinematales bacterium]|nr:hypothetical protein [Brevinematales bacterium]
MKKKDDLFKYGSIWLIADFHLHTKSDKEFEFNNNDEEFVSQYINQLENNFIGIGVVSNHNKFNRDEYELLYKSGKNKDIFLLPGVELSVNDGSNGIHCIIVFDNREWIKGRDNFIEQFLSSAFEGIANRENENTRCKYSLLDLCKKLEEHRKEGRDSFVIMAHIEQSSGFYNELKGGRISQIVRDELFKRSVLAFQKLRTYNIVEKLKEWFGDEKSLPALVEGSDCKNIEEVGVCGYQKNENDETIEKKTFIKIGSFTFEAIKYSLIDKENRLRKDNFFEIKNSYIKSISFVVYWPQLIKQFLSLIFPDSHGNKPGIDIPIVL